MIIALAILCIVLAVGYSFNFYVNRSIRMATEQSQLQFSALMAGERIREIVRFADEVKILQEDNNVVGQLGATYSEAIYVQSGSLVHYKDGAATDLLGSYSGNVSLQITFNKADDLFLWYKIRAETSSGQAHEIDKEIQILNIGVGHEIIKDFGNSSTTGLAIVFSK